MVSLETTDAEVALIETKATFARDGRSEVSPVAIGHALPSRVVWLFSAPAFGQGFMFLFMSVYMLSYATETLGMAPAAMGGIFLIGRIWDAVSDPIAGYLSDRTRTRWGRRRPWMVVGGVPVGIAFVMLVAPPRELEASALFAWMLGAYLLFGTGMTIFGMPHDSFAAELSDDYHERNRVFGIRRMIFGIGSITMFALTSWLETSDDPRRDALWVGVAVATTTALLMLAAGVFLREREAHQGRGGRHPVQAFRDVYANPHARLLLSVFFFQQVGLTAVASLMPFMARYLLGRPELFGLIMGMVFIVSVVSIPIWLRLGHRYEKKALIGWTMGGVGIVFAVLGWIGEGQVTLALVIAAIAGFAIGGTDVLTPSLQADVVDYDEHRTGQRKEGVYFAAWHFVSKLAAGIAAGLAGQLLDLSGFVANQAQNESTLLAIRLMVSGLPLACYGLAFIVFLRFRFSREDHRRVRTALDERMREDETTRAR